MIDGLIISITILIIYQGRWFFGAFGVTTASEEIAVVERNVHIRHNDKSYAKSHFMTNDTYKHYMLLIEADYVQYQRHKVIFHCGVEQR